MVHEWVTGFNMVSVWVGLWVDRCIRGGGCGCCLVGLVGVGLFDFFFSLLWAVVVMVVLVVVVVVVVAVMVVCSGYIILLQ